MAIPLFQFLSSFISIFDLHMEEQKLNATWLLKEHF